MTRFVTLAFCLMTIAVLNTVTVDRALAWGPSTTPSVTGSWSGLFLLEEDPKPLLGMLEITDQDQRRFEGMLLVGDSVYVIDGTVAASGEVSIIGNTANSKWEGHLRLRDQGGGAAMLLGSFNSINGGQMSDRGVAVLLHSFEPDPDQSPPDVRGTFDGAARSGLDGTELQMFLDFKGQQGTSLSDGRLAILDPRHDEPLTFDLVGTVAPTGEVVLTGLGPGGFIRLTGESAPAPDGSPRLIGDYLIKMNLISMNVIRMNFADEDFGIFDLHQEMPPVAIGGEPPDKDPIP